jgi:hypothetical protein
MAEVSAAHHGTSTAAGHIDRVSVRSLRVRAKLAKEVRLDEENSAIFNPRHGAGSFHPIDSPRQRRSIA